MAKKKIGGSRINIIKATAIPKLTAVTKDCSIVQFCVYKNTYIQNLTQIQYSSQHNNTNKPREES